MSWCVTFDKKRKWMMDPWCLLLFKTNWISYSNADDFLASHSLHTYGSYLCWLGLECVWHAWGYLSVMKLYTWLVLTSCARKQGVNTSLRVIIQEELERNPCGESWCQHRHLGVNWAKWMDPWCLLIESSTLNKRCCYCRSDFKFVLN